MTKSTTDRKATRRSHLRWVPLGKMRVSPRAQREFNPGQAEKFAADFDLEGMGYPVVNLRDDGHYDIVDGQHRIGALRLVGFDDTDEVQCECYEGLTEEEEAELFLRRDTRRAISSFDKFRIALTAGRPTETDVDRIVRANGLVVSADQVPGAIHAPSTLVKVYTRSDGITLGRSLRLARDAYGDAGMSAPVIDGLGLLCQRYNGQLDDAAAVERLSKVHGGVNGLLGKAENLRRMTGNQRAHCVAAAAVEIINARKGGKRLPSWWKS